MFLINVIIILEKQYIKKKKIRGIKIMENP